MSFETDGSAISVAHVSKKYKLFKSPQERVREALHPFKKKYHREFWALSDINLEIPSGRTFGIIGRNGSGKSTLLQIISGVLQPTAGAVRVHGRISSILELGAGFNPEFTGRENVFVNGALMGFSKNEMKKRMPLIETFADIGEFIDQPVKIYSSGMFVRLAFAAAIHVDPDVLIIDEALAVGDAKFQHKCYQKFREYQNQGKTILFVTHDIGAIVKHCQQTLLLEKGQIIFSGEPKEAVHRYLDLLEERPCSQPTQKKSLPSDERDRSMTDKAVEPESELGRFLNVHPDSDQCFTRKNYNKNEYAQRNPAAELIDYLVVADEITDPLIVSSGVGLDVYLKARFHESVESPLFGLAVKTVDGVLLYALNSFHNKTFLPPAQPSDVIIFRFSLKLKLAPGDYFFDIGIDQRISATEYACLERRNSLIHLHVMQKTIFHGLADLEADCQEVQRIHSAVSVHSSRDE